MDIRVEQEVRTVAQEAGVPFANLMAVVEVESNGVVFAAVDGASEPLIRWEGHYFYKALSGAARDRAVRAGLASPKAQAIKNPRSQQARWDTLLKPGMEIDRAAAIESCSLGVGQVMGFHWRKLGFRSADELLSLARSGAKGQVLLMVRYCQTFGLVDELQRGDFAGFARGYNGPNYRKFAYDAKMARAARRYGGAGQHDAEGALRMGNRGARVREMQALLKRGGYLAGEVDGDFGPATRDAVKALQKQHGLDVDGLVGPDTWKEIAALRQDGTERPGVPTLTESVTETREGKQGVGILAGGGGAGAAANQLQGIADKVSYSGGGGWTDYISAVLYAVAGVLVAAGLAWMVWGWLKARRD